MHHARIAIDTLNATIKAVKARITRPSRTRPLRPRPHNKISTVFLQLLGMERLGTIDLF